MSNHDSSIDRAQLRPAILRRASRHLLRTRTWTMTGFVLCWLLHPPYLQERVANAERSQVYHSVRENLMPSSSQDPISTGRPGALLFSTKNMLNPETFFDGEVFFKTSTGFGNIEPLFRFSNPETFVKSILESHRDHMLAEAKSEIMKQECKVDSLNTCSRELQRQAHSQRLELDDANCGYEESRREQFRLQEELDLREQALRDTRIRNIHEMKELRRVQEMRVDEFSIHKLRDSHATIQELISQMQEAFPHLRGRCCIMKNGSVLVARLCFCFLTNPRRSHSQSTLKNGLVAVGSWLSE